MKVHTQRALARLKKAEKKIAKQGFASMKDAKNLGMEHLRSIVPYETGWLYRTIKGNVSTAAGGPRVKIRFDPYITPNSHRNSVGNYPNFSLVRWAATSPKAKSHFKNGGDPRWMKRTRAYLMTKVPGKVRNDYKGLKL